MAARQPERASADDIRASRLATRPIALDLFSGVGGLSLGAELAGFHVHAHVEVDETAARYAEYNFPFAMSLSGERGDIRKVSGAQLVKGVPNTKEVALIAGGPPCQGFSYAGKKNPDDPLNDLVLEMARIVLEIRPLAFLIENVPGIRAGDVWQLDDALKRLGAVYRIHDPTTLVAAQYGVPQERKRVFVLGYRRDLGTLPTLPAATHSPPSSTQSLFGPQTPTVAEAISDLPDVDSFDHLVNGDEAPYPGPPTSPYQRAMREASGLAARRGYAVDWDEKTCTNCRRTQHGPDLLSRLASLSQGKADPASSIRRLEEHGLSTTIRAGTTSERGSWSAPRPCHYRYNRVITTRECARLQSFPDWFRFHPVKWHGNRQVGNAVPPLLSAAVAEHVVAQLRIGHARNPRAEIPLVIRDQGLIRDDLASAEAAGFDRRAVSHQVRGTRREDWAR